MDKIIFDLFFFLNHLCDGELKTYDYMLNKKGRIVPDLKTPLDIPDTRWIDLRLQELPQDDAQPISTDETVATNAE